MKDSNTADCFQVDAYYYYSSSKASFCEGYTTNDHAYTTSFSAIFIILTAFYSLFFYRHNLSLLRFISSSFMFNGIASFLNHWYGTRDWLFMDNVSLILSLYLLLLLCVYTFVTNYEQLVCAPSSGDTRAPVSPVSPASPRSISIVADIDYAHQMEFANSSSPTRSGSLVGETQSTLITATRSKLSVCVVCFVLMCFLIHSNITGCGWKVNTNDLFIIFTLIAPLVVFSSLALFYLKSKQDDFHLGTVCHSAYTADLVFRCYIRGVITVCIGNLLRVISETACKGAQAKHLQLPGHMVYNAFSFYGYALISVYIMYLSNDMQGRPCFFQTMGERHLSVVFIWFHWLFPSLVYAVTEEAAKRDAPDLLRPNTLQLGSLPMDLDGSMDMDPDLLPQKDDEDDVFETYSVFLQHWHHSDGEIVLSDCKEINERDPMQPITLQTTQIRVMEQSEGDQSCGYYALFFISKLSQIFRKLTTLHGNYVSPSVVALMQQLRSQPSFDSFRDAIMNELVRECDNINPNADHYPWSAAHVTSSGVLERPYLQFLQNDHESSDHHDALREDGYPTKYETCVANIYGFRCLFDVINLLEFSQASLKTNHLPLSTLRELEYFFHDRFMTQKEDYKIFLIGSAIHYVVCALFRTHDHIDILYLDSQNQDILHKPSSFLREQVILPMKFTSWCNHGWHLNDMRRLAKDSMKGIQFVVTELLTNAVCNIYSKQYNPYLMRDALIKMNVYRGFLGSFNSHALQPIMDYISDETHTNKAIVKDTDTNQLSPEVAASGWYVFGVNSLQSLTLRDELKECSEDELNMAIFQEDCESVVAFIKQRIQTKSIADIKACGALVKAWISSYYPAPIIERNIVNVLNALRKDAYDIPNNVMQSLYEWSALMMLFASNSSDGDSLFWERLSTTLRIVQMISETDDHKKRKFAAQSPSFCIPDIKELSLVLKDVTSMEGDICLMISLYTYHPNQAYYDNYYHVLKHYCVEYGLLHSDDAAMILRIVMAFIPTSVGFGDEAEEQKEVRLSDACLFIVNNDDLDTIVINCYVSMARGEEMWLGLIDKNTFEAHKSREMNSDHNGLLQVSTIHAFGSANKGMLCYEHGNWISFVISIKHGGFKYDVKIYNKYGDEQCVHREIKSSENSNCNSMYFMCVMKDVNHSVFIEKGMTV